MARQKQRFNQKNFDGGVSAGLRYKTRKQLAEQNKRIANQLYYESQRQENRANPERSNRIMERMRQVQKAYHKSAKARGYWGYLSTANG